MFEWIIGKVGEIRIAAATGVKYRYNGTAWIINGTGTPSSAWFPTVGNKVWEIREDLLTGGKYKWSGAAWVLIVNNDSDEDTIPSAVEDDSITNAMLKDYCVTSDKIADFCVSSEKITNLGVTESKMSYEVIKVATVEITSEELLAMNTTPKVIVPAAWAWTTIIVDKIIASLDYGTAAYATNTTLEFRYTDGSGTKVTADIAALLNATADKVVSVWGIEAATVLTPAAAVVALVATGDPVTWDSPITITTVYRVIWI